MSKRTSTCEKHRSSPNLKHVIRSRTYTTKTILRSIRPGFFVPPQEHDLLPRLQSAYRRHHSTETALLRVLSDIYAAADRKDVTLLGLLDLSAAFDCVDHDILARRLQQSFGFRGTALSWLQSFLYGRTQQCVELKGQWTAIDRRRVAIRRATGLCSRPTPVLVVHSRVVRDHRECRTYRTLVRRRHAGVHQCSSCIRVSINSALHLLR